MRGINVGLPWRVKCVTKGEKIRPTCVCRNVGRDGDTGNTMVEGRDVYAVGGGARGPPGSSMVEAGTGLDSGV